MFINFWCGSINFCRRSKFWRGSKFGFGQNLHARTIIVDFCKYSCIPEYAFSQKQTAKHWLNILALSVVITSKTD